MGQEITTTIFDEEDEILFHQKLRDETKILKSWFDSHNFENSPPKCGIELEAWLVSKEFTPAPFSDEFINKINNPSIVPEISKFNFELNSHPIDLRGSVFSKLENQILTLWKKCEKFAEEENLRAMIIGTLPTLRDHMLTIDVLSPGMRYRAMNERVMKLRQGSPIRLHIEGKDEVVVEHDNVITECAATSLQIHLGITQENAPRYYNASIVASAFMAAACANSPYFFGKELWEESRIAIFEQSVNLKSFKRLDGHFATRVSLGNKYVKNCLLELFLENLDGYPILLPDVSSSDPEWLDHLRLQNGTIWRWNRPLVGLSKNARPSLRLEFRVPSAGPSIADVVANTLFQIALVEYFAQIENLTDNIPFDVASKNFYDASTKGLDSQIKWIDGRTHNIQQLLFETILPGCRESLIKLKIDGQDIKKYFDDIIHPRILSGKNGANWQKSFVHTHGPRFQEMLEAYYQNQKSNSPVHLWKV